jgi:hypothetical protein
MQMAQDDVSDTLGIDAETTDRLARADQELALARRRDLLVEARVDHDRAIRALDQPDIVSHRHRTVVRIAADEALAAPAQRAAVADRIDLVGRLRDAHCRVSPPSTVIVVPVT